MLMILFSIKYIQAETDGVFGAEMKVALVNDGPVYYMVKCFHCVVDNVS